MNNFSFKNPTKILFGKGCIANIAQEIPTSNKILVVYGGGSVLRTGVMDQVRKALSEHELLEFSGIEPNPRFATALKAVELIKENQIDFLLAVGGGSVIDATKFIAAAASYQGDAWDILTSRGQVIQSALPFATVLTLPATGSEMNSGAVITHAEKGAKLPFHSSHCFPKFSALDPEVTYSLPKRQIANGVVDTFIHVTEQYLTYPSDAPIQDGFAETLLRTLIDQGPKALSQPKDYSVRANLMWTATLALNGLIGAGVPQDWATHMLGHEVTALKDTDHACTLAAILPSLMEDQRQEKSGKLVQYATEVWGIKEGSNQEKIDQAIALSRQFFEKMGIKTHLSDYGLNKADITQIVQNLKAHQMTKLGENGSITPEVAERILNKAL